MSERFPITHVAIRFQGKVYSLPEPNRHCDVVRLIIKQTGVTSVDVELEDEGFLDSSGRYLTRKQALVSAQLHNQVKGKVIHHELYSENLW